MSIKGILFDKDGTLVKFQEIWLPVTAAQIERLTADETLREKLRQSIGWLDQEILEDGYLASGTTEEIIAAFAAVLNRDPVLVRAEISQLLEEKISENQDEILPTCDLLGTLKALKSAGIRLGLVTADDEASSKICLSALGIYELFDFIGTDAEKPNPEVVSRFCEHFGLKASEVAVVGDTTRDMQLAKNAGALAVGVLSGIASRARLAEQADLVLPTIEDLITESGEGLWTDAEPHSTKPILAFPVISDIHIGTGPRAIEKFSESLTQLNQLCPLSDALLVVGDLTENGKLEEFRDFMVVKNSSSLADVPWLITIGNHDYWNGLTAGMAQQRFLTETGNEDLDNLDDLYFTRVIKGYHFILLATEDGCTEGTFSQKQLAWLESELEKAQAESPVRPIFVFQHQPLTGTIRGSKWGLTKNRDLFYNILAKYPQVIDFAGHTHFPLNHPRIVHQQDFTAVGTSTGAYLYLDEGHLQGEIPQPEANDCNQAWIIEVYEEFVRLRARDITKKIWLGEYKIQADNFIYTDTRDQEAPVFTENATVQIEEAGTDFISLSFSQATDNLFVYDYLIDISENNGQSLQVLVFAEFYKHPIPNPQFVKIDKLTPARTYHIEIRARDGFDNISKESLITDGQTLE